MAYIMSQDERLTYYQKWTNRFTKSFGQFTEPEQKQQYFMSTLESIAPDGLESYRFVTAEEELIRLKSLLDAFRETQKNS